MKRGSWLLLLALWAATAQADGGWDSLWRNADQRGEKLLQQGKAAEAARTYNDPRRKAYAELQAGEYRDAARDFAAFDDSDAHYNRGNALAQAGQLQQALSAYDAALARDANNQDAKRNRELVAKVLQQQPPQSKQNSDQDNSDKDKQNGDKNQSGQSGSKDSGNKDSGNKDSGKQQEAKDSSNQRSGSQQQNGQNPQGKAGKDKDKEGGGQPDLQAQARDNASGKAQADSAEQAQRDAAAALGKPAPGTAAATQADAPASERQLAQEQWLRAIPDDPGGLLRRKFMIEHLIRQQGGKQ
ncbi:MAG: tetratricopeptide repeat protein [Sideroxydans sp.]|nr:tetratricopeptide repeat protein [Sideroxydans sp.]